MHEYRGISSLRRRCEAIGLSPNRLCRLAGVAESTWHRAQKRVDVGAADIDPATSDKLTTALLAYERELLAHLVRLHGVPGDARGDAPDDAPDDARDGAGDPDPRPWADQRAGAAA